MYTATIKTKEELEEGVRVTVTFSNGVKSFDKVIIPQTESQFHSWKEGVLFTLNEGEKMKANLSVDTPQPTPPTQAQIDESEWFRRYNRFEQLEKVKAKNILTGAKLTALDTKIATLKSYLDTNAKVEYLDLF